MRTLTHHCRDTDTDTLTTMGMLTRSPGRDTDMLTTMGTLTLTSSPLPGHGHAHHCGDTDTLTTVGTQTRSPPRGHRHGHTHHQGDTDTDALSTTGRLSSVAPKLRDDWKALGPFCAKPGEALLLGVLPPSSVRAASGSTNFRLKQLWCPPTCISRRVDPGEALEPKGSDAY